MGAAYAHWEREIEVKFPGSNAVVHMSPTYAERLAAALLISAHRARGPLPSAEDRARSQAEIEWLATHWEEAWQWIRNAIAREAPTFSAELVSSE